jgi:transcriptional regulator GlxA family with amidase domain
MDLAGPDQALLEAIGFWADLEIDYCSFQNNLKTSSNLPFGHIKHFREITFKEGDYLLIPGANVSYMLSKEFRQQTALLYWIRELYAQKVNICSICTGAYILAQNGLLDHRICTTHFKHTQKLQAIFPKVKMQENILFTACEGLYTSAGITSGIDLILYIIEKLKGGYFAHKVAREMVVYHRRSGHEKQENEVMFYRNHIHAGVHNVQDWLYDNLDKKTSLSALAAIANMSSRNFTRIFKKETSLTVNEYITLLRKEKINHLIQNPDISRVQIAQKCGLKSERHLNRLLQKME